MDEGSFAEAWESVRFQIPNEAMIKCAVEKAPSHDPCGCGSRPSFIYVLEMWLGAEKRDVEMVMAGVVFCRDESSSLVKRVAEFSYERADEPLHGPNAFVSEKSHGPVLNYSLHLLKSLKHHNFA